MAGHATSRVCIVPSQLPPHQAAPATPPVDAFSAASPSVIMNPSVDAAVSRTSCTGTPPVGGFHIRPPFL
ncbi:hypothetical protein QC762_0091530 [Podospora pseudocomata]|uniref:Uncharacterized protein n=2 Tax=Podospora TaxID=5144 RepID=A0ABR0G6G7_9PEZI|nr:hypothetical protein QC762_0091530 [Podospora pseudocomata]KAK4670950.1 hypothetical protein QC764_0090220 [Podospora pseudoanserina]